MTRSLFQLNIRVILLALISIIAYYVGIFLSVRIAETNFVIIAVTNIGIYCLWEICSTGFKRKTPEKRENGLFERGMLKSFSDHVDDYLSEESGYMRRNRLLQTCSLFLFILNYSFRAPAGEQAGLS